MQKSMHLKNWIWAVFVVILAPLCFVACGEDNTQNYVSAGFIDIINPETNEVWNSDSPFVVAMSLESGATYQLEWQVMPSNATNKDVEFSSANERVATVNENGVVTAVSVGSSVITITSKDRSDVYISNIRVDVFASAEQLSTPTNVRYDATTGNLVWDAVTVSNSSYVPSYRLDFTIAGATSSTIVSTNAYNEILPDVEYTVTVTALGNGVMYDDSEPTASYTFAQMAVPSEFELVSEGDAESGDRTYYLRFKLSNLAPEKDDYTLSFTNLSGFGGEEDISKWEEAFSNIDTDKEDGYAYVRVPSDLSETLYGLRVSTKGDNEKNYFASESTSTIRLTRLSAPTNLSYRHVGDTAQLTWSSVPYATAYKILIKYNATVASGGGTFERTVIVSANSATPTMFDFANLENPPAEDTYTSFEIYMYALGADTTVSNTYYLDSAQSDVPAQQQLESVDKGSFSVDLNNDGTGYEVRWVAVDNASTYVVYLSSNGNSTISSTDRAFEPTSSFSLSISFDDEKLLVGENYIKIVALPSGDDADRYISSEPTLCNENLIKLATPEDFSISQGSLVWDAVDDATEYRIYFNDENTMAVIPAEIGVTQYSFEPTAEQMPQSSTSYFVYVVALSEENNTIDSAPTTSLELTRFGAPSNLRVENGELTWDFRDGDNSINTKYVEVQITNRNGETVIPEFTTSERPLNLDERLNDVVSTDRYFVFRVRAINNSSGPYINGDWSDSIMTYQLNTPTNVRIENGVIMWDPFIDENIAPNHSGIRYVLRVGSQEYGVNGSPVLDINSTSAVITGLTANTVTYGISLQVTIQHELSGGYGTTILGEDDVYIINSGFSEAFNVRQLATPSNVTVRDTTLYWTASNSSLNQYRIELYRINVDATSGNRTREDEPIITQMVTPQNPNSPSWDFSLNNSVQDVLSAGAYQFVIYAIGTNYDANNTSSSYGYLTSYASSYVEIYKLDTPTLDVDNGMVRWNYVYSELNGTSNRINSYIIYVTRSLGENAGTETYQITVNDASSTTLDDLPSAFYNTPLTITIKAVSSYDRVFDSEISAPYMRPSTSLPDDDREFIVQKPAQVAVSNVSVEGMTLSWTEEGGSSTNYIIYIYKYDNSTPQNATLRTTLTSTTTSVQIPELESGNYYVQILRRGFESGLNAWLDSKISEPVYLERFASPVGVTMTRSNGGQGDPVLTWSILNTSDNMRFRIDIVWASGGNTQTYTYYMPANAITTTYSLNLNGKAYDINGGEVDIENFSAGTLRIYVQAVLLNDTPTYVGDGKTIHLLYGQPSSVYSAYVYQAPSITIGSDGIIALNKSNQFDRGTQLIFTPVNNSAGTYSLDTGAAITIQLASGVNTFDMSDSRLEAGVLYHVQTKALGNSSNLIESEFENCLYLVQRLETFSTNTVSAVMDGETITNEDELNGWYTKDGTIYWNAVEGVTRYDGLLTNYDDTISRTAFSINSSADVTRYSSGISDLNAGTYYLQFTLVGGASTTEIKIEGDNGTYLIGYVTSAISSKQAFTKLSAPNDYSVSGRENSYSRIVNGEFDFGVRDEDGVWIDNTGATAYILAIDGESTITYKLDGTAQYFDAKEYLIDAGRYVITLYSVGNTWTGASTETIYLTSDAYNSFTIIYGGKIDDLNVANGLLNWTQAANGSTAGYDIEYQYTGSDSEVLSRHLDTNTYSFDGDGDAKGSTFNYIRVRHTGTPLTTQGAYQGYVNTSWSESLNNVVKLPDIEFSSVYNDELYINDWGQLAWRYGANYNTGGFENLTDLNMHLTLNITYLGVSVGGRADGWNVARAADGSGSTYGNYLEVTTVPISEEDIAAAMAQAGNPHGYPDTTGILTYTLSGYVQGTVDETTTSSQNGTIYLNSDTYDCSAYKLNDATSFGLDEVNGPGVRLEWDISNCSVEGFVPGTGNVTVDGDVVLFTYRENGSTQLQYKKISSDLIDDIALWNVATFDEIRFTVLSSDGNAFGSDTITIDNVNFNYFKSGKGTIEEPFVIESHDSFSALYQLELVYWLPEVYFELNEDIVLDDITNVAINNPSATSNFPVPVDFNSSAVSDVYKSRNLTGGFDGNGHTISNIVVGNGATSYGWWRTVTDTEVSHNDLLDEDYEIGENDFGSRGGVIADLTLEAYSIDVSSLAEGSYSGLFAEQNYGLIMNCTSNGADKYDEESQAVEVVSGTVSNSNVYIGGIAGYVGIYSYTPDGSSLVEYAGDGRIENSTNMLNINLTRADTQNFEVYVGGIAGHNVAGYIIGSNNGSSDMASVNNQGEITAYRAGGIVGLLNSIEIGTGTGDTTTYRYGYVSGCTNYGVVTTTSIMLSGSSTYSTAGGIVSQIFRGFVTYNMNYGTVTTNGINVALGGITGAINTGSYVLSNVNIGDVRYNQYYGSVGTTPTSAVAGNILGLANGGNVFYNYFVQNNVYEYSREGSVINQSNAVAGNYEGGMTDGNNNHTELFTTIESDLFLNINQEEIDINGDYVSTIVETHDGKYAQFTIVLGENPKIEFVSAGA